MAQRNEPRMALRQLKQAVASGFFSAEQIEADADFAPLRTLGGWPQLLNSARARQQKHEAAFDPQLMALIKKNPLPGPTLPQDSHGGRAAVRRGFAPGPSG
nr:hypothetical protein [Hymenobacter aerophilus]